MDINNVVEKGRQIAKSINSFLICGIIGGVVAGVLFVFLYQSIDSPLVKQIAVMCTLFLYLLIVFEVGLIIDEKYDKEVKNWKDRIAFPYIETIAIEKRELVFCNYMYLSQPKKGSLYTDSSISNRVPLMISFIDEEIVTIADWYNVSFDLSKDEAAYIEYQKLNIDLGHGVDPNYYNVKVHLPKKLMFAER
ncbi:hypothetical protein SMD22_00740 (plasmid) [Brevibacillus halotolerans]|nr:hypothetical protein SMD22_00740 [Brevibacillus halotolerans]